MKRRPEGFMIIIIIIIIIIKALRKKTPSSYMDREDTFLCKTSKFAFKKSSDSFSFVL